MRKFKLLGHLLRAAPEDPLHQVVFRDQNKKPRIVEDRRSGRPREDWLWETMDDAFDLITNNQYIRYDEENPEHLEWQVEVAKNRDFIFETNNKKNTDKTMFL